MTKKNMIRVLMVLFLMSFIPLASYGYDNNDEYVYTVEGYIKDFGISSSSYPKAYITLKMEAGKLRNDRYRGNGKDTYIFYFGKKITPTLGKKTRTISTEREIVHDAYSEIFYLASLGYALKQKVQLEINHSDNIKAIFLPQ